MAKFRFWNYFICQYYRNTYILCAFCLVGHFVRELNIKRSFLFKKILVISYFFDKFFGLNIILYIVRSFSKSFLLAEGWQGYLEGLSHFSASGNKVWWVRLYRL